MTLIEKVKAAQARLGVGTDGIPGHLTFDAVLAALDERDALRKAAQAPQDGAGQAIGGSGASGATGGAGGALAPSQRAFSIIREFEGFHRDIGGGKVEAYPDPGTGGAPWTIGYGSTGPDVKRGTVWTHDQAKARMEADVARFAAGVAKAIGKATTTQAEFDAMVSFAYNVGLNAFEGSTLLRKHKAGDKAGAANEFARWNKAAGKVLQGLVRRRAAEADLYRGK